MLETLPTPDSSRPAPTSSKGWGRRWIRKMQALGCLDRASRRQVESAAGEVLDHALAEGRLTARVHGSRWPPYEVRIEVAPLDDRHWHRVLEIVASRPLYAACLLAGEVPADLDALFAEAGCALLPQGTDALRTACTCDSLEENCPHVAVAHYVLSDALEADPFLLLGLRGRSRSQVLRALRQPGGAADASSPNDESCGGLSSVRVLVPLPAHGDRFWRVEEPLHEFEVDGEAPACPHPSLTRLGAPGPWAGPGDLAALLGPLYEVVGTQAARLMG